MLIYKREDFILMKSLPLIILILLLPIISPITIQTAQTPSHLFALMPVLPLNVSKEIGNQVNIHLYYKKEPAPMGIGDFGISPKGPFVRESTQWLGVVRIDSLSAYSSEATSYHLDPYAVTFQLNVVLNYEYNGKTYALWVQDVAFFDTQIHEVQLVDEIINLTAPFASLNGLSGNGEIHTVPIQYNGKTYYFTFYFDEATNYPGSPATLTLPATIYLLVNTTTNSKGQPVICLWYNDGYGWVHYDTVTVTSVVNASNVYFLVDGYNYTGFGAYYDAELIIGGPGDYTCSYIQSGNVYFQLLYWNGHNFQEVRNAYNFGSDSGEKVNNVIVKPYYSPSNGTLWSELTVGSGNLSNLWNQDNTTQLTIYSPVKNGYIYIYNESLPYSVGAQKALKVPFVGGQATLTLYPMDYAILVYQNGQAVAEANIYARVGNVSTNTTQFSFSISKIQISAYAYESYTLNLTINAYGNVTINVISPSSIKTSFTQETIYVDGQKMISLTIYPTEAGNFTLTINASIFPGFYVMKEIPLHVKLLIFTFTFKYNVIGQPLPKEPEINLTYPNGTSVTLQLYNGETLKVPAGTSYTIQQIISEGNVRWIMPTTMSGVINSNNTVISATYYEQLLVNFEYDVINGQWNLTPPNVTYQYLSKLETVTLPAKVWVNYNSTYSYSPSITVGDKRITSADYKGVATSPGTITVDYALQYYITVVSPIPVYALISGKNVSLTTGWYNSTSVIQIENITYYPTTGVRCVITSVLPSETVNVTAPTTIKINTIKQFYVDLSSPIPVYALINGKNETLESGWYNENTTIQIENITYYPTKYTRYIIIGIEPSKSVTVTSPTTIKIVTLKQYYITVVSTIPVKAVINGSQTYLNSSWINEGTSIYIINYTYYVTNNERYVITGISPQSFTVSSPATVNITTVRQFLVTINNVSTWYNQGSKITLTANVPIYDVGEFVGTHNVSPGSVIIVNSPITERLILHPNYVFYATVIGIILVIAGVVVIFIRRRK